MPPFPLSVRAGGLCLLCVSLAFSNARAERIEIVAPDAGTEQASLNGEWKFRYEAGPGKAADAEFALPTFDDSKWASTPVPSHWELKGFAEPTYAKVAEGTGFYRRTFQVPAAWRNEGQRVVLRFEGVLYGLELWVNGKPLGQWASGYNPASFDITEALQAGDNTLAVRVITHPPGWEFDTNDCWALSGIYREVTLFTVPSTHVQHFTARTMELSAERASLQVAVQLAGDAAGCEVRARLSDRAGKLLCEQALASSGGEAKGTLEVANPQTWTAETPVLHTLELTLTRKGTVVQRLTKRIGLKKVEVRDGVLCLNGRPIKLRGVNHHDLWPDEGRVVTREKMLRDLRMIQAANCNYVRTSHYPPHPLLLELCDELGLYVMDEVPFGFGDEHLNDPAYQEILYTRARATVLRDENHASVLVWSVGNENPNTPLTFATAARVKELDPTRPVCFPQIGSYFAGSHRELPAWVDIAAPHYPRLATVKDYAANMDRPVIFTEYAHALGLATDQIQAEWAVMQASPRLAGGSIWMFQDQGILRKVTAPMSDDARRLAVQPDAGHVYDTNADQGMDGIVYSDRTPQVDYLQVRKVYAPIQVAERELEIRPGAQQLTLHLENRLDFTSLEGVQLFWGVLRNGNIVDSGCLSLSAPARGSQTVTIPTRFPEDLVTGGDVFTLSLQFLRGTKTLHSERCVKLVAGKVDATTQLTQLALPSAPLRVQNTGDQIRVHSARGTVCLDRISGQLSVLGSDGTVLVSGIHPHAGRRFTQGERMRAKKELTWPGSFLGQGTDIGTEFVRNADGSMTCRVRGRYVRPDDAAQSLEGSHEVCIHTDGTLEISYDYHFVKAAGHVLEAGLSLLVPPEASGFRWVGAGPYAGYPGKDQLNEFGRHQLHRDDLHFQGNRRQVDSAVLSRPDGAGVAVLGSSMELAVERVDEGTALSHNAFVAGRGTKFDRPEDELLAETMPAIRGRFVLVPLGKAWPEAITRWHGAAKLTLEPFAPYLRSYDQ